MRTGRGWSNGSKLAALMVVSVLLLQGVALAANPLRITSPVNATKKDVNPTRTYAGPSILIDPDNPLNVFMATVDMRSRRCTMLRSGDGGATWKILDANPSPPSYPFCFHTSGLAPQATLAWGRNKTIYWLTVGWDTQDGGNRRNQSVLVARSTNFGDSWTTTIARSARGKGEGVETERNIPIDIAVDTKSGNQDTVYVSWRANYPLRSTEKRSLFDDPSGVGVPSQPTIAVSTDGGKTFSEPINAAGSFLEDASNLKANVLNTGTSPVGGIEPNKTGPLPADRAKKEAFGGNNPYITIDEKGTLYVLWQRAVSPGPGLRVVPGNPFYLSKSSDKGKTWTVTEAIPASQYTIAPWIKWSPQGGGILHMIYEDKVGASADKIQGDRDIYYRQSRDGGKTWTEPKMISDADPAKLEGQYGANMSIAANGRIDVAWYDFRDDPGANANDIYYTSSTDNGQTWLKNVRLTDKSINRFIGPWSNEFDMRQPIGIASTGAYSLVGWDDTRNSDSVAQGQDLYTATVQYKPVSSGIPNVLKYALAALGGVAVVGLILLVVAVARRGPAMPEPAAKKKESAEVG